MRLKYYLRGLGIGMAVMAVLMIVLPSRGGEQLSDEEVRARALQLGMVENTVLSNLRTENSENRDNVSDASEDGSDVPKGTDASSTNEGDGDTSGAPENTPDANDGDEDSSGTPEDASGTEEGAEDSTDTSENTSDTPESTGNASDVQESASDSVLNTSNGAEDGESITFTIRSGQDSLAVSRNLENLGLIDDAQEYNHYLMSDDSSRRIRTGTFSIPIGSTWEEIKQIIAPR